MPDEQMMDRLAAAMRPSSPFDAGAVRERLAQWMSNEPLPQLIIRYDDDHWLELMRTIVERVGRERFLELVGRVSG